MRDWPFAGQFGRFELSGITRITGALLGLELGTENWFASIFPLMLYPVFEYRGAKLLGVFLATVVGISISPSAAFGAEPVVLAAPSGGLVISFNPVEGSKWGMEIRSPSLPSTSPAEFAQPRPARIDIFEAGSAVRAINASYDAVVADSSGVDARAEIKLNDKATANVHDRWQLTGDVVLLSRTVTISGQSDGGFDSAIYFQCNSAVNWSDISCLAPGALYGDPTYDGERSPGGTLNFAARRFLMREDMMPAPLFAFTIRGAGSVAILDPKPRGDSTVAETKLSAPDMIDGRFQFGALGAWQDEGRPIEFGFMFPGSVSLFGNGPDAEKRPSHFGRYHPIVPSDSHHYEVCFRFSPGNSFRDLTRESWRWAWRTLKPQTPSIDLENMRRVLLDHLQANAATIDGRTGIPFVLNTMTDQLQWNWTMIAMGFVGKNIECADQLLREGDRDTSTRGQAMRATGLNIIASLIHALPTVPLQGAGYDLATGQPWDHVWLAPWLRNATEDMRVLMRAYRREISQGREHPEWLAWVRTYTDWLLQQQRDDGSFPRRWKPGSNEIAETTGTTSYAPVPLLVILTEITGDKKYRDAAIRAADYIWKNWGERGLFIGGASDNPNITDKEAGMLSLEAFLSLFENTHDPKWLERAQAAGNFAESWIWIWNLPMPIDSNDAELHWKKGVPTIGLQGITALHAGGADEYLDWAVPSFAKLATYTKDSHYLDVARVLLLATKSMVAIPGRLYDMKGPGWQQEHWRLGPGGNGRGVGSHRFWLPWISANHLAGITGLEEFDPALYRQLSQEGAKASTHP